MHAPPFLEEHPQIDCKAVARAGRLDYHPLADLFPLMQGREFQDLVADVRARGLLHPITTLDGKILDGRNRYRACLENGIAIETVAYTGTDPRGFVIASNLQRRHLNESQRAMVAVKLANLPEGRPSNETAQISAVSQRDAAKHLNVSRGSVQHAVVVRDKA
jgi:ParB-like chromosome segregation protein Spo0J